MLADGRTSRETPLRLPQGVVVIRPCWRNRIAQLTFNQRVQGSNPWRGTLQPVAGRRVHGIVGLSDHFWDYVQSVFDIAVVVIGALSYRAVRRRNGNGK